MSEQADPVVPGARREHLGPALEEDHHEGRRADEAEHGVAQHPPEQHPGERARSAPAAGTPPARPISSDEEAAAKSSTATSSRRLRAPIRGWTARAGRCQTIRAACATASSPIHAAMPGCGAHQHRGDDEREEHEHERRDDRAPAGVPDGGQQDEADAARRPDLGDAGVDVAAAETDVRRGEVAGRREQEEGQHATAAETPRRHAHRAVRARVAARLDQSHVSPHLSWTG